MPDQHRSPLSTRPRRLGLVVASLAIATLACGSSANQGASAAPPRVATELRVMTLNLRHGPDDGVDAWPNRRALVVELLREHAPDIVGVQEAVAVRLSELVTTIPAYDTVSVHDLGGSPGHVGNAILFRADRLQLLDRGVFWLSETPDVSGSVSWQSSQPRTCVWAELRDRHDDVRLFVFDTHLDHRSAPAREHGLAVIEERSAGITRGRAVIVTGDFNMDVSAARFGRFLERAALRDTLRVFEPNASGDEATYHGFGRPREGAPRVDGVLASEGAAVVDAAIVRDGGPGGRYPSDHFPVIATVRVTGGAGESVAAQPASHLGDGRERAAH